MTVSKRPRGRPRGTGRDDGPHLRAMADLMANDSRVRPTTAIRRIILTPSEADIRRLQVKWKESGQGLLAEAVSRRNTRMEVNRRQRRATFEQRTKASQDAIAEFISSVVGGYSFGARSRELYDSPAMRTARELYDSPAMRTARELYDGPAMRTARELQDSPAMRVARELMKRRLGG